MAELMDSLHIFGRFGAIVEAIDAVNIHQSTTMVGGHQRVATHGRTEAVSYKDRVLDAIGIQHLGVDGGVVQKL